LEDELTIQRLASISSFGKPANPPSPVRWSAFSTSKLSRLWMVGEDAPAQGGKAHPAPVLNDFKGLKEMLE